LNAAWDVDVTPTQKLVLLAICNHADIRGLAFPSITRLSSKTGLSERAIRSALQVLVDSGRLRKRSRNRRSSEFWIEDLSTSAAPHAADNRRDVPATPATCSGKPVPRAALTYSLKPLQEARECEPCGDNSKTEGPQDMKTVLKGIARAARERGALGLALIVDSVASDDAEERRRSS